MENRLWYTAPAKCFEEALPLGNGRLGAMFYGQPQTEKITLNVDTLWCGHPYEKKEKDFYDAYLQAKQAFREDRRLDAQDILNKGFSDPTAQAFLPAGTLNITVGEEDALDYERALELDRGMASCGYTMGGSQIKSTCFASGVDNVLVYRICADTPRSFGVALNAQLKHTLREKDGILLLSGRAYDWRDQKDSYEREDTIKYTVAVLPVTDGQLSWENGGVTAENARELTLYLSIRTSYVSWNQNPDREHENAACRDVLLAAEKGYGTVEKDHVADFSGYYNRVKADFGGAAQALPTDLRIQQEEKEIGLVELLFNYGRYLVISSSRAGSMATTLQGIWNERLTPPWGSGYTTNINTEMNYWPVLMCSLPEFMSPLFELIKMAAESGKQTAREFYHCGGWVGHHNFDLWGKTSPANPSVEWMYWCMSSGWMCRHLFEYYEYTGDKEFLEKTALPIMESAAEFYMDILEEVDGKLVITPATSPENAYLYQGQKISLGKYATMSQAIVMDLFGNLEKTYEILGIPGMKLYPQEKLNTYALGSEGQLLEFDADYEEAEIHHRHASHLYGLYPGESITIEDERLANACKKTLERRGDYGTGWALGWKTNLWAKLKDGDHTLKMVHNQLRFIDPNNVVLNAQGGSYPNLLDAHPPFQIDGNFGITAGIAQMFLQCECGKLKILPALPTSFKTGSMQGLTAKGNVKVSIWWEENAFARLELLSETAQTVAVEIAGGKTREITLPAEKIVVLTADML